MARTAVKRVKNVESSSEFEGLLDLLKRSRGLDFTGYKRASLMRRVTKRMHAVGARTYTDYMKFLERDQVEFDRLFDTVLINVTHFFRDGQSWEYLAAEIIPQVIERRGSEPIRIWSAGCATGQEPYSLAMLFAEALKTDEFLRRVKIYATDLDENALAYARQAAFTPKEVEDVPEAFLNRYFYLREGRYCFVKPLRHSMIFGRNDLVDDAPISKIDLLVCRNTLMYFDSATQTRILKRFHFAIRDAGFLFLGKAETISSYASMFDPIDLERRVFMRVKRVPAARLKIGNDGADNDNGNGNNNNGGERGAFEREIASTAAFERAPLAQFVVDSRGQLALANERARHLFRLVHADLGRPLQDLEVSYRPLELRSLLDQIRQEGRPIRVSEVAWQIGEEERWFEVQMLPLYNSVHELIGVAVSFDDITRARGLKIELQRSHGELETAYEELQSTNEELETTNEELQSTVEELETTNEELQSTNEELETMNEELQSTNDELRTTNEEMQTTVGTLDDLNVFLRSIFASLGGGVAVIDQGMRVKVWNHMAEELWGLRAEEVVDRSLMDLDIGLPVQELRPLIAAAAASTKLDGAQNEKILKAINRRGRTIECRITANPLIDPKERVPQGVILLMEQVGK